MVEIQDILLVEDGSGYINDNYLEDANTFVSTHTGEGEFKITMIE